MDVIEAFKGGENCERVEGRSCARGKWETGEREIKSPRCWFKGRERRWWWKKRKGAGISAKKKKYRPVLKGGQKGGTEGEGNTKKGGKRKKNLKAVD